MDNPATPALLCVNFNMYRRSQDQGQQMNITLNIDEDIVKKVRK